MNFKALLQIYLMHEKDNIITGRHSKLKYGDIHALREFVNWADEQNYIISQPRGPNGPAFFCLRCGAYLNNEKDS